MPGPERTGGRRRPTRRREATTRLLEELAALRVVTRQVADNVRLELDGGLAGLERRLAREDRPGPRVRDLEAALEALSDLRVKPRKGRPKDLVRIRDLLRVLEELLGE